MNNNQYLIPHNYTNNGRVFNLFPRKDITKAIIWFIPVTFIIFYLPIEFKIKLFAEVLLAVPPTLAILAGYANWIAYVLLFLRKRTVYYNVRKGRENDFVYKKAKSADSK